MVTPEFIHQDIQRMKKEVEKDEKELGMKKEVSDCCGASVLIRNNEPAQCQECFDDCDIVEVDKN